MKIADDFDAIRQRARELAEERHPLRVVDVSAGGSLSLAPGTVYVDSEADVTSPIGMIVA